MSYATRLVLSIPDRDAFKSSKVATDNLSPEQKKQAEGFVGGATNAATGVAKTTGGAVKGVLDTTGDTVCALIFFFFFFMEACLSTHPKVVKFEERNSHLIQWLILSLPSSIGS